MINIFVDGGARGNPGPAAVGVYAVDENNNELYVNGEKIGYATNNIAEYSAVIVALSWLVKNKNIVQKNVINIFLDSELVYSQISGFYKTKNSELRKLLFNIRQKEAELDLEVHYSNIPREKNKKADQLVNMALDNKIKVP